MEEWGGKMFNIDDLKNDDKRGEEFSVKKILTLVRTHPNIKVENVLQAIHEEYHGKCNRLATEIVDLMEKKKYIEKMGNGEGKSPADTLNKKIRSMEKELYELNDLEDKLRRKIYETLGKQIP